MRTLKIAAVTLIVGGVAFVVGPHLWPPVAELPAPPGALMPAYLGLAVIEALAFGLAVAFVLFGWGAVSALALGRPWLNRALYVSIAWLLGNWWFHDGLHMHVGLDMSRLLYIEVAFHLTLLACGAVLALAMLGAVRGRAA